MQFVSCPLFELAFDGGASRAFGLSSIMRDDGNGWRLDRCEMDKASAVVQSGNWRAVSRYDNFVARQSAQLE